MTHNIRRNARWPLRPTRAATLIILFCLGMATALPIQAEERWFLLSRHGECEKVESLKRIIPYLGKVSDPHAFAALMRENGHKVTLRKIPAATSTILEVTVPEKELFLIFATSEMCGNARKVPYEY